MVQEIPSRKYVISILGCLVQSQAYRQTQIQLTMNGEEEFQKNLVRATANSLKDSNPIPSSHDDDDFRLAQGLSQSQAVADQQQAKDKEARKIDPDNQEYDADFALDKALELSKQSASSKAGEENKDVVADSDSDSNDEEARKIDPDNQEYDANFALDKALEESKQSASLKAGEENKDVVADSDSDSNDEEARKTDPENQEYDEDFAYDKALEESKQSASSEEEKKDFVNPVPQSRESWTIDGEAASINSFSSPQNINGGILHILNQDSEYAGHNFRIYDVDGDGHCGYHQLAHCITVLGQTNQLMGGHTYQSGQKNDAYFLRGLLQSNRGRQQLRHYVETHTGEHRLDAQIQQQVGGINVPNVGYDYYASTEGLSALAKLLKLQLVIVGTFRGEGYVRKVIGMEGGMEVFLLHTGGHFMSLLPID